jgi:poly(3-hydroxybutyrate) depolymerase
VASQVLYYLYELNHATMAPVRAMADMGRLYFSNPVNPMSQTTLGKSMAAGFELFERVTRRYGKPDFGISETVIDGIHVAVHEETVLSKPFCRLQRFSRQFPGKPRTDPKLLIVAPMSGHYATLLRGTVETMLPNHDVYITDWVDARNVPLSDGHFDLDDYVDYVIEMIRCLGEDTHVMAVCQPSVPVLAATALMNQADDRLAPASITLMGGPIDTRINPTAVNSLAQEHGIDWFERNVIVKVPFPNPGMMRDVYPGFLQLTGFMSMNLDRHMNAHADLFVHLVQGDGDSAEKHREFYDEYMSVMDLTAEFYLQTVETVFINHDLPEGRMRHRGRLVDPSAITRTAVLTVEGERDDISGVGQTEAAHRLLTGLAAEKKVHYLQLGVGHYGVFNGARFRSEIAPRIADFVQSNRLRSSPVRRVAARLVPAGRKAS